jgi:hypothetical protein
MTGYGVILAALALIAVIARILRRVMKRRQYGFPVSWKHRQKRI